MTISQAVSRVGGGTNFYTAMGDFLDEFYRQTDDTRRAMLADAPGDVPNVREEHAALFAAAAHKLANDYGLPAPAWVFNKKYIMREKPYFDCNAKGNLRLLFMYKSPTEFKHKNLFVDENFLSRV
jgi:hypothetical protein